MKSVLIGYFLRFTRQILPSVRLSVCIITFATLTLATVATCKAEIILQAVPVGETITSNYSSTDYTSVAAPTNATGTGMLGSVLSAAVDYWESKIDIDETRVINFGWSDFSGALGKGNQDRVIFSSSYDHWFIDGTPFEPQEYSNPVLVNSVQYSSSGASLAIGNYYQTGLGQASLKADLFTTAVHELGHALGIRSSDPRNEYNYQTFSIPKVGGHLDLTEAVMRSNGVQFSQRNMLSEADIYAAAVASGYSVKDPTIRPNIGVGDFYNRNSWQGGFPPDSLSEVVFSNFTPRSMSLSSDATSGSLAVRAGEASFQLNGHDYEIFGKPGVSSALAVGSTLIFQGDPVASLHIAGGEVRTPEVTVDGLSSQGVDPFLQIKEGASLDVSSLIFVVGDHLRGHVAQDGQVNANGLFLGAVLGSHGSYQLNSGTLVSSQPLYVGLGGVGIFGQESGFVQSSRLTIGHEDSASGTYTLNSGTLEAALEIGYLGDGFFDQNGGAVTMPVSAGSTTVRIGEKAGSEGKYNLNGGSLTVLHGDDNIYVGQEGRGEFNINESSQTTTVIAGGLVVGNNPGSNGLVAQEAGTVSLTNHFWSGRFGYGEYRMSGGILTTGGNFSVGTRSGSEGYFTQTGGSVVMTTGQIGQNSGATGKYTLANGQVTSSSNFFIGVGGLGEFQQDGGTLTVQGDLTVGHATGDGDYFLHGGDLALSGDGYIGRSTEGGLGIGTGALATVANGSMYVGDQEAGKGLLIVSGGELSIQNSDRGLYVGARGKGDFWQDIGTTNITGTLVVGLEATGEGLILQAGGDISVGTDLAVGGYGQGEYIMSGGMLAVGNDLVVSRNSGSLGTFNHSGGSISVTGRIFLGTGDAGLGTYSISGDATLTSTLLRVGFGGDGFFQMDGGTVEISGDIPIATPAGNEGTLALAAGRLISHSVSFGDGNGQFNFTGGKLTVGTFAGDLVNQGGTLAPGDDIGTTTIVGDYTQEAAGSLEIEIGGLLSGTAFDFVDVTGVAGFAGDLLLSMIDGFAPATTDLFTIFDAGVLLGSLDNVLSGERLDTVDGSGSFLVNYGSSSTFDPSQIVLSDFQAASGLLGDFDFDADIDGSDFLSWQRGESPDPLSANDLADWQANFGAEAGSFASSQTVPEPTSLALLAISLLLGQTVVRHSRHNDCV